jgi:hypothetical protein
MEDSTRLSSISFSVFGAEDRLDSVDSGFLSAIDDICKAKESSKMPSISFSAASCCSTSLSVKIARKELRLGDPCILQPNYKLPKPLAPIDQDWNLLFGMLGTLSVM